MRERSNTWKALVATGNFRLESVAVIGNTTYASITAPVINRALFSGDLSIGNCISGTCTFSLLTDDTIPKGAEVEIKMRLTDEAGTTTTDWMTCGTFYISKRRVNPVKGLVTLECYDRLLMANQTYDGSVTLEALIDVGDSSESAILVDDDGYAILADIADYWPMPQIDLVYKIAQILGVDIDERTSINASYTYPQPEEGTRLNSILQDIGICNVGNWVITPENKLRLVPAVSASGAGSAEDPVDVIGVTGRIDTSGSYTVTGLRATNGDYNYSYGNDNGYIIDLGDCCCLNATMAQSIFNRLNGVLYVPYTMDGAIYDPAAELGDYVVRLEDVGSVLCSANETYNTAFRGNIAAPCSTELDEYPYKVPPIGTAQIQNNAITNDKIHDLSADKIWAGSITTEKLDAGCITADKISANAVTANKLATDAIKSTNYQETSGVATTGSFLNLADGSFKSKNLQWDETGYIESRSGMIGGWIINNDELQSPIYHVDDYDYQVFLNPYNEEEFDEGRLDQPVIGVRRRDNDNSQIGDWETLAYISLDGTVCSDSGWFHTIFSMSGVDCPSISARNSAGSECALRLYNHSDNYSASILIGTGAGSAIGDILIDPYSHTPQGGGATTYGTATVSGHLKVNHNTYLASSPIITSDRNKKKNISSISKKLEKFFSLLKPVKYRFRNKYATSGRLHTGFISQDVEQALLDSGLTDMDFAGFCKDVDENGKDSYYLRYEEFIALNTHMIQRLMKRVDDQEKRIKALEKQLCREGDK